MWAVRLVGPIHSLYMPSGSVSNCTGRFVTKSVATSDFNWPLRYAFASVSYVGLGLHLLHWIAVTLVKGKLHRTNGRAIV